MVDKLDSETLFNERMEAALNLARYEFSLLPSTVASVREAEGLLEFPTSARARSFSNRKITMLRTFNLSSLTNMNFTPSYYKDQFWVDSQTPKEHLSFLGYDEDLGPISASITTTGNTHLVHLRTYWKTSLIPIAVDLGLPSSLHSSHTSAPKAHSLILYLALEKYLEEIEEDWFRLLDWQQKIQFTAPHHKDGVVRFSTDHRNYVSELKREVTFAISAPQVAKQDLPRVVGQLERVEDLSIRKPLLNIEASLNQNYIFTDIITHLSGLNRTMEQRDTFNTFQNICGQALVLNGQVVDREELKRPEIMTEDFGKLNQAQVKERRATIRQELLESELKYVKKIKAIQHVFVQPLRDMAQTRKKAIIVPYDIKSVFNNIEEIIDANTDFLQDLMMFDPNREDLGNLCERHINKFGIYQTYITGYRHSLDYHCALEKKNDGYYNFVMAARDHPECDKLALKDLLVMPVQRLPRYKLLFTDYLRFTPKTHPEYKGLYNALVKVNEISNMGSQRLQDNAQRLSNILRCINDCPPVLLRSSRYLVTQFDCTECDVSTLVAMDPITLFLLSDCIIVTKRNQPSNKKPTFDFISWISLNGIDIMEPGLNNQLHGIVIRACLDFSEDLYWDYQELHLYIASTLSDQERFYKDLSKAAAVCRAVASGCSCLYQTINDIDMFFFIYDRDSYQNTKLKNELALHYIENHTTPPDEYFQTMYPSLVHGMVFAINCRFSLLLKSKVAYHDLTHVIHPSELSQLVPEDPFQVDKSYQLPYLFREFFFHQLIYHQAALRGTPAYLHMQHIINRCLLESLFGLHFPDSQKAHGYLNKLKSMSRSIKNHRCVLSNNGSANASIQPRKSPYQNHNLGTLNSDTYRDIAKPRSITAPDPTSIAPSLFPFSAGKSRISTDPTSIPKHQTVVERKKRGSFIKMSRFFSWGK